MAAGSRERSFQTDSDGDREAVRPSCTSGLGVSTAGTVGQPRDAPPLAIQCFAFVTHVPGIGACGLWFFRGVVFLIRSAFPVGEGVRWHRHSDGRYFRGAGRSRKSLAQAAAHLRCFRAPFRCSSHAATPIGWIVNFVRQHGASACCRLGNATTVPAMWSRSTQSCRVAMEIGRAWVAARSAIRGTSPAGRTLQPSSEYTRIGREPLIPPICDSVKALRNNNLS